MSMQRSPNDGKSLRRGFRDIMRPTVLAMLFFGISAGIPILLIFSSLSLWLREAGVSRSSVTFFSWAALGYSFKFVWAPLVDRLPLPLLTRTLGQRRSWILFSQLAVMGAILFMALTNPAEGLQALTAMAVAAVLLGFSSATQDIVIDAFRIESDSFEMQALLSAAYIAGYRVGMIIAGAGALHIAFSLGTSMGNYNYEAWRLTYIAMALTMMVGVLTTLLVREPSKAAKPKEYSNSDYGKFFLLFLVSLASFGLAFFLSSHIVELFKIGSQELLGENLGGFFLGILRLMLALAAASLAAFTLVRLGLVNRSMVQDTYIEPIQDFFKRYGPTTSLILLLLVGSYRVSDIVLGVISNVFYQDLGYTKVEIANVVKTFGLVMTLLGGFLGGILTNRLGVMKMMVLGAVLSSATNLLFIALAEFGRSMPMLFLVISADNLSAGLASVAFIAFLSSLTNISFTAVQYAIFSSLMTLFPKLLGGYSGSMVDVMGYRGFFIVTCLLGGPVLYLLYLARNFSASKD